MALFCNIRALSNFRGALFVCLKSHKFIFTQIILLPAILIALVSGCQAQSSSSPALPQNREITVFAGSASKPPLDEAAQVFEKNTGIKVFLTYGGSGAVLSQMLLSKTGDVYIPGSPDYLSKAEKDNAIFPDSTKIIAYLIPAINVQRGNPENIQSLSGLARPGITVGIGNPNTVCVGLYAVETLDKNRILAEVFKNIITQASSCDATAALISFKSVDAVLGWEVFQAWNPQNIETIYLQPEQISRLAYIPAAISRFAKEKEAAGNFINFLTSDTGKAIFQKWGYNVTEDEARKFAPDAEIGGEYQLPDSFKALNQ